MGKSSIWELGLLARLAVISITACANDWRNDSNVVTTPGIRPYTRCRCAMREADSLRALSLVRVNSTEPIMQVEVVDAIY